MKEMALILQGGGALGAFEYGAVTRLVELGWTPRAVTGVSIGAINAAAVAGARGGDIVASLDALWGAITMPYAPLLPPSKQGFLSAFGNPNFYHPRHDYLNLPKWTSLYDTSPMLDTLGRLCDFGQINDAAHMRLGVTATDLHTGALATFSNHAPEREHRLQPQRLTPSHIMASGSLPPGFAGTEIEGRQYWDGGLFSNTPIDALIDLLLPDEIGSLPIFTLDLFPSAGLPAPDNLMDVQSRATMLQYQNRFWAQYGAHGDIAAFAATLDALEEELPPGSPVRQRPDYQWLLRRRALRNLQVVQAPEPVITGASDFSAYGIAQARQSGRDAIDRHFAAQAAQPAPAAKRLRSAA
ncbi:patatin-like phospholipase family protein [Oxalobacteraceae bacterium A2-2]